ncbi:MAG: hypothetical protein CSA74_11315 [Rhodobacterales bacterium]|nr:MAG: hypothetical protein CSA74_11315 [Rhodobacterales bacterium]
MPMEHAEIISLVVASATGTAGSAIAARLHRDGYRVFATTPDASNTDRLTQLGYAPAVRG